MEKPNINLESTPQAETEGSQEIPLEDLRDEIDVLHQENEVQKEEGEGYSTDLEKVDASQLEGDDLEIYEAFRNERLTKGQLRQYQTSLGKLSRESSRANFAAWVANQLGRPEKMKWFDPETYKLLFGENKAE